MADDADFFTYHRAASNKLKKRFLKKPNVAEASDEFEQLKNHLARIECFPYAAFTAVSKAKCEQGLMNPAGEIDALVDAGRFFLKAKQETDDMLGPNFNENLENAVWCFTCAIKIYKDNNMSAMAGTLSLEIAEMYFNSRKFSQAIQHYKNAIDSFASSPQQAAACYNKLLICQLISTDYHGALSTSICLVNLIKDQSPIHRPGSIPLGYYSNLYKKVEITRLLLLMTMRDLINIEKAPYIDVLEPYMWPDEATLTSGSHFLDRLLGEDIFVYLRSLVMACSSNDFNSLTILRADLMHMLNHEQNELLRKIVDNFK